MLGEKPAIRKYRRKLPSELAKRYGSSGPYTRAQIDTTIRDLRLSRRHVHYAYLLYCDGSALPSSEFPQTAIDRMHTVIAGAASGGVIAASADAFLGLSEGDGVSSGDGGSGGDG